ncbi:beta-3-deoxy-D-manno-oct-2-ulosonic acid transferase [Novosphingobium sp. BW1]|nr:beta-3-deoxy-D-manno-oct-2-ulosonic acid transferase [Novosphingobium sp. BW1]
MSHVASGEARARLFESTCSARVGGAFWLPPAGLERAPGVVLRPRALSDLPRLAPEARTEAARTHGALWVAADTALHPALEALANGARAQWRGEVDPWSVLPGAGHLHAHGDDDWIALARIARVPVTVLSPGLFGVPGDSDEALDARAAQLLSIPLRDPFGDGELATEAALALLADWRQVIDANRGVKGQALVAACGMAWWKRTEIRRFLWTPEHRLRILSDPRKALAAAHRAGGALAIWPSRVSAALLAEARAKGVPLVRVEDGFVRSVGLGSNLVPPSSIVVDRRGIHFDPTGPSDLEDILATHPFPPEVLERARALSDTIIAAGISKYGAGKEGTALPERQVGRRVVLVPGQVEDDMSVRAGGHGLASNLELLRRVRAAEPDAEIWWRPHPDVDAGHRVGAIDDTAARRYADHIVRGGSMAALLDAVDAVHVLTSLTGFEALMRGREVTCHGTPFYAGWGLTRDLAPTPERRGRTLTHDELVAGVLILYPRYLDPVTGLPCPPETLVARMAGNRAVNRQSWIAPVRRAQGRAMAALRRRLRHRTGSRRP